MASTRSLPPERGSRFGIPIRVRSKARRARLQTAHVLARQKSLSAGAIANGNAICWSLRINLGSLRSPRLFVQLSGLSAPSGRLLVRPLLRKHQMSYQDIDKEIAHLELVFGKISTRDRFPLSYWHQRLLALLRSSMMPAQRQRVARLEATLRTLGESRETA
jgi:hypothetical protein